MADVQLENGFTQISNHLTEALTQAEIGKRELVLIHRIIRETYGWRRRTSCLTPTKLAQLTGFDRNNISRSLAVLEAQRIILREGDEIGIQKDYGLWMVKWRVSPPGLDVNSTDGYVIHTDGENRPYVNLTDGYVIPTDRSVEFTETVCNPYRNGARDATAGADLGGLKERKESNKERSKEMTVMRTVDDVVLSDELLDGLKRAIDGIPIGTVTPRTLPGRLRARVGEYLKDCPDEVVQAFDLMPFATQVAWHCRAIEIAKGKGVQGAAIIKYAGKVIANKLIDGADILSEEIKRESTAPASAVSPLRSYGWDDD